MNHSAGGYLILLLAFRIGLVDPLDVVPVEKDPGGFEGELGTVAIDQPLQKGSHGAFVEATAEGEGAPEDAMQ